MLAKNIYVHVVYNCSVSNGVKYCLNIGNPKLGQFCFGGWLKNSHGDCEFLLSALLFTIRNLSVLQNLFLPRFSPVGVGLVASCELSAHCRGTRAALT